MFQASVNVLFRSCPAVVMTKLDREPKSHQDFFPFRPCTHVQQSSTRTQITAITGSMIILTK